MTPRTGGPGGKRGHPGAGNAASAQRALLESPALAVPLAELLTARRLVLDSWSHERTFDRPGAGVTALCRVVALDPAGDRINLYAGVTTAPAAAEGPVLRTSAAGVPLFLWLHPHDPLLPDLPWALSPSEIAEQVFAGADAAETTLSVTGYRPLRRAVIRARSGGELAYIKVVLPGQAEGLRRRHELLEASAVPAPVLIPGAEGRSAVVLAALPGSPLLPELAAGTSRITPAEITALLDDLPEPAMALRRRPAWADRAPAYGRAAGGVLPGQQKRVHGTAKQIKALVADLDPGPVVPVHGDFYEGNLLTADGRITGVLDVDGLGPGHRVDDLACFLGHLAVLARISPESALPGALSVFHEAFESAAAQAGSSAAALNARAAGVALSLVPGARAGQLDRQANAELRLAAAEALLERALHGRTA
ncbi:phosphotransferase [Arthrobacter sp. NPDC055585]